MKRLFPIMIASFFILPQSCSKNGTNSPGTTPPDNSIQVTGININLPAFNISIGRTQQLTINIVPANATNPAVTWSCNNTAVATVSATGLVTAVSAGTVTITARSVANTSVSVSTVARVLTTYDVYIAGYGSATASSGKRAMYWKNGTAFSLPGGHTGWGNNASAITVSGNDDVHIAGTTVSPNQWQVATYWKNGVPVQLTNPSQDIQNFARSIAVSGNIVYVESDSWFYSGCPNCTIAYNASYFKINGNTVTKVPLVVSGWSTDAFSIAVSDNDVYVSGSQSNNFVSISKFWKNDVNNAITLSEGTSFSKATAITTSGTDVFVAGFDQCTSIGCIKTLKLWKNNSGGAISLTNGMFNANANTIVVAGTDVYVAGYEVNTAGNYVAKYWRVNGNTVTSFSLTNGQTHASVNAAYAIGNDLFLAGFEIDATYGHRVAKYWRIQDNSVVETVTIIPPYNFQQDTEANAIFVK